MKSDATATINFTMKLIYNAVDVTPNGIHCHLNASLFVVKLAKDPLNQLNINCKSQESTISTTGILSIIFYKLPWWTPDQKQPQPRNPVQYFQPVEVHSAKKNKKQRKQNIPQNLKQDKRKYLSSGEFLKPRKLF